jgi:hypothetical protein
MIRSLTALLLLPIASLAETTSPIYEEAASYPRIDGKPSAPMVESRLGGIYGIFSEPDTESEARPGGIARLGANKMEVVHRFTRSEGLGPISLIAGDDGVLYGSCLLGGEFQSGTIWSYNPASQIFKKLADVPLGLGSAYLDGTFAGALFGRVPNEIFLCSRGGELTFFEFSTLKDPPQGETHPTDALSLASETDGTLYGTTRDGGLDGAGVFFRLTPSDNYERLAAFDATIGSPPNRIVKGSADAFYGISDKVTETGHHPQLVRMTTDGQVSIVSDFGGLTFANDMLRSTYIGPDQAVYLEISRTGLAQSDPADYLYRFEAQTQSLTPIFTYTGTQRGLHTMRATNGSVYGSKETGEGPHIVTRVSNLGSGPFNMPPYALPDVVTLPKGETTVTFNPLRNDGDVDGKTLSVTSVTVPQTGTAEIDPSSKKITYTSDSADVLFDTFTYMVSDGKGATATARVRVRRAGPSRTYAGLFTFHGMPAYCRATISNAGQLTGVLQALGNTIHLRLTLNEDRAGEIKRDVTLSDDDMQVTAETITCNLDENLPAGTGAVGTLKVTVSDDGTKTEPTLTEVSRQTDALPQYTITIPPFDPLADSESVPDGTNVQVTDQPTVRPSRLAGAGWASMEVSETGNARLIGKLADGRLISFGGPIAPGNILPIYAVSSPQLPLVPAPPRGFFAGALDFGSNQAEQTGGDCSGVFRWTRPWTQSGIFQKGFAIFQPVVGFRYRRPGELGTPPDEGAVHPVTLELGAIPGLTSLETDGTIQSDSYSFPDVKGSLTVYGRNGIVSGTVKHPQLPSNCPASGVVIRKLGQVIGFYKTPNGTGRFVIKPQ